MLKLEGQVLKFEPFTSKKGKELVSMIIFGTDKEVYNSLAEFKNVARIDEGQNVELKVSALPGRNDQVTFFVSEVLETVDA